MIYSLKNNVRLIPVAKSILLISEALRWINFSRFNRLRSHGNPGNEQGSQTSPNEKPCTQINVVSEAVEPVAHEKITYR